MTATAVASDEPERRPTQPMLDYTAAILIEFAARSTRASAKLEGRLAAADYVRPERVQRYLDERR